MQDLIKKLTNFSRTWYYDSSHNFGKKQMYFPVLDWQLCVYLKIVKPKTRLRKICSFSFMKGRSLCEFWWYYLLVFRKCSVIQDFSLFLSEIFHYSIRNFRYLWVVLGDFGWYWLFFVGFGWFWMVACFVTNVTFSISP